MRRRLSVSSVVWLLLGAAYFILPLAATVEFSLRGGANGSHTFSNYHEILRDGQFRHTLWLSFQLAIETIVVSLLLFVPTVYLVHLKLPRLRPVMIGLSLLPFVVPPIVLVVGLLDVYRGAPQWFIAKPTGFLVAGYVVLSFPFIYWSLDAGFRAIDVHTLTEAAQNLGAGWRVTLTRVILPNIRAAALAGAFLTLAIVMGEYTMAALSSFFTFPVYINYIGETKAYPAAALSAISFAITWLAMLGILFLPTRRIRKEVV